MQLNSSVATRSAARGLILGMVWVVAAGILSNLGGCGQKGPLTLPGAGTMDLTDFLPRFEIPAVVDSPWNVAERPLGLRLRIRRIAILDHLLEVGADFDLAPVVSSRAPAAN